MLLLDCVNRCALNYGVTPSAPLHAYLSFGMAILFVAMACVALFALVIRWVIRTPVRSRVRITIDAGRVLEVNAGDRLYHTLVRAGVMASTTCGGYGSCAQCRCRVLKGGGRITERELPYFSKGEQQNHWRLACQVRVHGDLTIELPERQVDTG